MSKAKHTPGPWVVESNGYYPVVRKHFHLAHHMDVCGPVHGYMYSADQKSEQEANARLIAAAPELLAALKALLQIIDDAREDDEFDANTCGAGGIIYGDIASEAVEESRAAIAKAEGRSS